MVIVRPLSTSTTVRGGESETERKVGGRGNTKKKRKAYQGNDVMREAMITLLMLMLAEQLLVREPESHKEG